VFETAPIFALLSRALDGATIRQSVHTTNIANADVDGFRRLDVVMDAQLPSMDEASAPQASSWAIEKPRVVATHDSVRLDQEMALMAKDAIRYQALLGAVDRTIGLLSTAIHEGREG
jgi:flagellar basal-body rod protein FlgB